MQIFRKIVPLIVVTCLAGVLSACSLAADVTPPPGYQEPTEAPQVTASPVTPPAAPDVTQGAAVYSDKCAPCHGQTGMGDGPMASQLSNPVAAIGSPELARKAKPSDWFAVVSDGRFDRFMPGFSGSLSVQQRWDVLAYVYSLSSGASGPTQAVELGKQAYQSQCASCHGDSGKGDGNRAASLSAVPGNLDDLGWQASQSADDIYQAISAGAAPAMPGFSAQLNADQIWAVVNYVRSIGFTNAQELAQIGTSGGTQAAGNAGPTAQASAEPATTQTPAAPGSLSVTAQGTPAALPAGMLTVSGTVANGSGGPLPAGLPITLHGYDAMAETYTKSAVSGAGGNYSFPLVENKSGRVFMISVVYKGTTFDSDLSNAANDGQVINLPVKIYEPTTDLSTMSVDRLHVFFDFSNPGVVQVVELYVVSNSGNHTLVAASAGQPLLKFDLPQGASNLQFRDGTMGQRFVQTQNGFGDTASIPPGNGQFQELFAYDLSYPGKLDLAIPINLNVKSAVVMLPKIGIQAKSAQLQDGGVQSVQGTSFQLYTTDNLAANSTLNVSLSGNPGGGTDQANLFSTGSMPSLLLGIGAFALALLIAGLWMARRQRSNSAAAAPNGLGPNGSLVQEDADVLIDAIAALDDLYQAGKLPEGAYHERRSELKSRLSAAMK